MKKTREADTPFLFQGMEESQGGDTKPPPISPCEHGNSHKQMPPLRHAHIPFNRFLEIFCGIRPLANYWHMKQDAPYPPKKRK